VNGLIAQAVTITQLEDPLISSEIIFLIHRFFQTSAEI